MDLKKESSSIFQEQIEFAESANRAQQESSPDKQGHTLLFANNDLGISKDTELCFSLANEGFSLNTALQLKRSLK
jgi:hypothetical protein